ncbi:MAG: sensor histidine kinase [Solirubrobacteraceae bacterium]
MPDRDPRRADRAPRPGLAPGALVAAALAACALCAATAAVALAGETGADRVGAALTRTAMAAVPMTVGLMVLARRDDRFARLLAATGALWSLTVLAESHDPLAYSAGRVAVWIVEVAIVYLLLAFPSGHLSSADDRRALGATALIVGLLYVPTALVVEQYPVPSPYSGCGVHCPHNAFALVERTPAIVPDVVRPLREVLSALVLLWVAGLLIRRARQGGPLTRRMLAPVVAMAIVRGGALGAYDAVRRSDPVSATVDVLGWVYLLSLALIALSFAAGMLWRRLHATSALERLTLHLHPETTPATLRAALADALEDQSLEVVYRLSDEPGGWVDETGARVGPPPAQRGRTRTEVRLEGRLSAVIVSDAALALDPALLQAAASYAVVVLDNGRLVEQLSSAVAELSASRARIVAVSDDARRAIERDVHDGAQQRLVALRIKLGLESERVGQRSPEAAAQLERLAAEVEAAIDEVRSIARGIYPALLGDRGLVEALRAVALTAPVPCGVHAGRVGRLPLAIERAVYFACLAALQHAGPRATAARITLWADDRLRFEVCVDDPSAPSPGAVAPSWATGPRDRLDAVGGELRVEPAPGGGTLVSGSVPL